MIIIYICAVMLNLAISLILSFALIRRTHPSSWSAELHILSHLICALFLQPIYIIPYLMVTFYSSPLLIKLSKRTSFYSVIFGFLPLLVASGSFVFT
ncbi:hypothetical protein DBX26_17450 [Vibrio sp. dhg]|nr:hypothetical protein DBX26_17450 [Vibrio sp. dhg]